MAKGIPSSATFVVTAGSAGSVTMVAGDHPTVMPPGTYSIVLGQDEQGYTLVLITPFGTMEVPNFIGTGWLS
jgi:hypothetical protein